MEAMIYLIILQSEALQKCLFWNSEVTGAAKAEAEAWLRFILRMDHPQKEMMCRNFWMMMTRVSSCVQKQEENFERSTKCKLKNERRRRRRSVKRCQTTQDNTHSLHLQNLEDNINIKIFCHFLTNHKKGLDFGRFLSTMIERLLVAFYGSS